MANVFDQFDAPQTAAPSGGNVFDQFDAPQTAARRPFTREVTPNAAARRPFTREAPTSMGEDIAGVTRRILPAANTALAETAGRALDVVPYFISRVLGASEEDAVHPVENLIKNYTVPNVGPPQSGPQKMADAGGKMIGESLPFIGASSLAARAPAVALDAAPTVANAFRRAVHGIGQTMAKRPVTVVGAETLAAGESGVAGEIMRHGSEAAGDSPDMQRAKESAGQIIGPTAFQLLPTSIMARAVKPAIRAAGRGVETGIKTVAETIPESVRPGWLSNMAEKGAAERAAAARTSVGEKLKGALSTPESQAGLAEADRLEKEIPGFKPGVARATNDQELLNTQQSRDTAATGADLRTRQEVYDASRKAVERKLESVVPPAEAPRRTPDSVGPQPKTEFPQDVAVAAGARRVDDVNAGIEQQRTATQNQLREQADSLPDVDRIAGGNALRDSRAAAQRTMDMETTRLRGEIAHPETPVRVGDGETTVGAALDRRAVINQEMRDYTNAKSTTVADVQRMRALQAERDTLDAAIDGASADNASLRAYTEHYRTENVPQFRQGASAEVGRRDSFGYGGDKVDPEKVAGKFFNPNEESAAAQFERSMSHDPGARRQMVDHALDDIRHNGIDPVERTIKKGFVDKWLQKNKRVLDQMPQTGADIRVAVSARNPDQLYARLGQLEQRQRAVAGSKLARALDQVAGPGQATENMVAKAIKDPELMSQIVKSAGGDKAVEAAVRRAVFDAARKQAPDVLTNPEEFLSWLKDNNRALSRALTPQHKADLETVARAAMLQNRLGRPEGTVATPKSIVGRIEDALGITVGSAASTSRGVAQGRTSLVIEGVTQAGKFFNRQAARASAAAWDEALANPEAAHMIAALARGKATPMQATRLHAYLLANGAVSEGEVEK